MPCSVQQLPHVVLKSQQALLTERPLSLTNLAFSSRKAKPTKPETLSYSVPRTALG